MTRWFALPSVQIVLCCLVYALIGYRFGRLAFLLTAPLFAAVMARVLWRLVANIRHKAREHLWLPVHGQHYVFRDITIRVLEDDDGQRWVSLVDVRKVVGATATDSVLHVVYPECVAQMGKPAHAHMRDDALVAYLGKDNKPVPLRFRTWVERTVMLPGQRVRGNLAHGRTGR